MLSHHETIAKIATVVTPRATEETLTAKTPRTPRSDLDLILFDVLAVQRSDPPSAREDC
jgi:hypothetical protein